RRTLAEAVAAAVQGGATIVQVRQLLGPSRLLGVSVKTVSKAELAVQQGADYLGCGAVCPTSTKDSDVIGIQGLRQVCEAVKGTPVVAIGGVGAANASVMVQAGAAGIAVVSAVFGQSDPAAAALVLRDAVDRALATHNHAT
ncbi:TMP-TENI domain-containing protein, partial [Haematococcus lacustris]